MGVEKRRARAQVETGADDTARTRVFAFFFLVARLFPSGGVCWGGTDGEGSARRAVTACW